MYLELVLCFPLKVGSGRVGSNAHVRKVYVASQTSILPT